MKGFIEITADMRPARSVKRLLNVRYVKYISDYDRGTYVSLDHHRIDGMNVLESYEEVKSRIEEATR